MHLATHVVVLTVAAALGCSRPPDASSGRPAPQLSPIPSATDRPGRIGQPPRLFRPGEGATEPVVISFAQPVIPASSISRHIGGGAFVFEVVVAANGQVQSARTLRRPTIQPPWPEFEEAYRQAALSGRYQPATYQGRPVPFCLTLSVGFHL